MFLCRVAWSIPGVCIGAYRGAEIKWWEDPAARKIVERSGWELPRSGLVQCFLSSSAAFRRRMRSFVRAATSQLGERSSESGSSLRKPHRRRTSNRGISANSDLDRLRIKDYEPYGKVRSRRKNYRAKQQVQVHFGSGALCPGNTAPRWCALAKSRRTCASDEVRE